VTCCSQFTFNDLISYLPLFVQHDSADECPPCQEGVPPGYEAVSLIEALNGPPLPQCALSATVMTSDVTIQSLSSAESPRGEVHSTFIYL